MLSFKFISTIKIIISVAIICFLFYRLLYQRQIEQGLEKDNKIIKYHKFKFIFLGMLAAFSIVSFFNFGSFLSYKLNQPLYIYYWDFFHNYIGSKYFPELGYYNLYYATVVADAEDDNYLKGINHIMNVENYHFVSREEVFKNASFYKNLFSPQRWQEFKSDIRFIKIQFSPEAFGRYILADHGYIASPVLTSTNSIVAKIVPINKIFFLSLLDIFLLLIMFWLIGVSFGLEIMLMSIIFFSVNYLSNFDWIGGSFLRYDWLLCSVAALCMINKNRYKFAGAFLSYATMTRIFPVFFILGMVTKSLFTLIKQRTVPERYKRLFVSFILTSLLLFFYGSFHGRGIDNWKNFSQRISLHNQVLLFNNTGFKMIFLHDNSWLSLDKFFNLYGRTNEIPSVLLKEAKKDEFRQRKNEFFLFLIAALFLFFMVTRNKIDIETSAWGGFLIFMFLSPSCYYYSFLLMFIVIFYKQRINLKNTLYLVSLFFVQILDYIFAGDYFVNFWLRVYYRASLFLFIYFLFIVASELYAKFRYQVD